MFYATHEVMSPDGEGPRVWAFATRRARDRFVKHGPRGSWSLVYPFEQKAIKARDARRIAQRDDFGDPYAYNGDAGGVLYIWGAPGYERFWAARI